MCSLKHKPDVNPKDFRDQSFSIDPFNRSFDQFNSLFIGNICKVHSCFNQFLKIFKAPVQDLSEQLTQLQYLVQLLRSLQSFHYLLSCFLDYRSCSRSLCYSGCSYNLGCSYCVLSFFFNYWSCSSSLCTVSCTSDLSYSGSCTCNPSCSPAVPKGSRSSGSAAGSTTPQLLQGPSNSVHRSNWRIKTGSSNCSVSPVVLSQKKVENKERSQISLVMLRTPRMYIHVEGWGRRLVVMIKIYQSESCP